MKEILVISGSTRTDSMNKKLAKLVSKIQMPDVKFTFVDLREYNAPMYDEDLEKEGFPEKVLEIRTLMKNSNGLILVTPEHNGTYSAVLKNIIDWTSRAQGEDSSYAVFENKKALVMAASPTEYGGIRAIKETQTLTSNIHMKTVEEYFSLPFSFEAFDSEDNLKDKIKYEELVNVVKKVFEA